MMLSKMVSVKLSFLVRKLSVTKLGSVLRKHVRSKRLLLVSSMVKLKAVSLLKLIQSVHSYLVHLLMFVQYVTQLTLKVKS